MIKKKVNKDMKIEWPKDEEHFREVWLKECKDNSKALIKDIYGQYLRIKTNGKWITFKDWIKKGKGE